MVSFSADPTSLVVGSYAALNWEVSGADTVSIDNGIGTVASTGTMQVSPGRMTTYRLTAEKGGVTTTATATITVENPFTIAIDAPVAQQVIQRPDVLVRGTFQNSTGRETGISVNGITALQYGNEFMANHVPLVLTATPLPEAALSPYDGELRIAAPVRLRNTTVAIYGPGDVETIDGPPELFELNIDLPGLYRLVVTSVSWNNETFTDEVAVLIYDAGQLDALLQSKWNAMKARLAAGDVPGAVKHYANGTKGDYETIFTSLGSQLPQIAQQMGPIQMIVAKDGSAKFRLKRSEVHQGQTYEITYPIYFITEENGLWKVERF